MAATSTRKRTTNRKTSPPTAPLRRSTARRLSTETALGQWPWHRLRWNDQQVRLALIGILILGAFFRSTGRNWDSLTGLHPDERFFAQTAADLSPLAPGVSYFDTARSTLNPSHKTNAFFVYGTLPIFAMRAVNWRGTPDIDRLMLAGRWLSTLADLGSVVLTFVVGRWWYGTAIGLGAAALFALAELPIQLSHFFPVDPFVCFFGLLAFAALGQVLSSASRRRYALWSAAFGAAVGLTAACKIYGATVLFCYLPAAWLYWQRRRPRGAAETVGLVFHLWLAVAVVALLVFRVAQPYAFAGPGFFDFAFSQKWLADLAQQYSFSTKFGDYPPTMQWIGRTHLFATANLVRWGFAPFGGLLGLIGLGWMGVRIFRQRESGHLPHWLWTVGYFFIFGISTSTPMQRYLLPIYPWLAIAAAWTVAQAWQIANRQPDPARAELWRRVVAIGTLGVLSTSLLAATALTAIYRRPVTRLTATEWLLYHAPGPITIGIDAMRGPLQFPLPFPYTGQLTSDRPYRHDFTAYAAGQAKTVTLTHLVPAGATGEVTFRVQLHEIAHPEVVAVASQTMKLPSERTVTFALEPALRVQRGGIYQLEISIDKPVLVFHLEGTRIAHETAWDDLLPVRWGGVENIGPIDPFGGIYPTDLDLDAYAPDTKGKQERIAQVLERAELLTFSSQRQWGSLSRLPGKYPVMARFYRKLLGCPANARVVDCYNRPQAYDLKPELGYRLVQDFRSLPSLGRLQFVDTGVEESLTVYDHPPVMIFENTDHLSVAQLRAKLDGAVVP